MQKRDMKAITLYIIMACWALCAQTGRAGDVVVGAAMPECYMKHLKGRRVALFSNQTGMVSDRHTLDILLGNGVDVVTIFSPEHGFRGQADAGEKVCSSVDGKTGVPSIRSMGPREACPTRPRCGR